ncbi:conserved hypothetical protein [Wolbachia endosymbiont of Drosophila ananassae]|nr:conserved hypothetical protein [Wolbachia endosymbiont of Drosophila ananassae]
MIYIKRELLDIRENRQTKPNKSDIKKCAQEMDDVEELEEIIDGIHEAKQFDEDFDSALICLSNMQNELDIQLENPPTELRVSHINVKTELTRL